MLLCESCVELKKSQVTLAQTIDTRNRFALLISCHCTYIVLDLSGTADLTLFIMWLELVRFDYLEL